MSKFISLTFDLEEFSLPADYGKEIKVKKMFQVSYEGCKEIRKLLDKFNIKVTFFVTKNFASKFQRLVREFVKKEHEIALHSVNFCNFELLKREKKLLEKVSRSKIVGFRTHKLRLPLFNNLKKIGIKYDSSLHPTYVPGRYNNLTCPRSPFVINDILEIPISVIPLLKFPFSFIWFRNFGLNYGKVCTLLALKGQRFINLYFHAWDFADLKSFDLPFYIVNNTGKAMSKLLEKYIEWCLNNNFEFIPLQDCVRLYKFIRF